MSGGRECGLRQPLKERNLVGAGHARVCEAAALAVFGGLSSGRRCGKENSHRAWREPAIAVGRFSKGFVSWCRPQGRMLPDDVGSAWQGLAETLKVDVAFS